MSSSPTLDSTWEHTILKIESFLVIGLIAMVSMTSFTFLYRGDHGFQLKQHACTYGKNTDRVTKCLKAHHVDQINMLLTYMEHLANVELKKESSLNPFYMENWKNKIFSHLE